MKRMYKNETMYKQETMYKNELMYKNETMYNYLKFKINNFFPPEILTKVRL